MLSFKNGSFGFFMNIPAADRVAGATFMTTKHAVDTVDPMAYLKAASVCYVNHTRSNSSNLLIHQAPLSLRLLEV